MSENIKLILGLTDNTHDDMIMLYLSKVETVVISYCNIDELNPALESFIEDKVVSIMKPLVTGGTQNTSKIKSISRGDTKIEYNVGEAVVSTSNGATLTSSDKEFLKQYRRARCW